MNAGSQPTLSLPHAMQMKDKPINAHLLYYRTRMSGANRYLCMVSTGKGC